MEREVARARAAVGLVPERSLDWLVLLSLARDWSHGLDPDVAATTAAVELPRTTVKRSLDGLAERNAVRLDRCKSDGRRRLVRPGPNFGEVFNPLYDRVYAALIDMHEPVSDAAHRIVDALVEPALITDAPPPGRSPVILAANAAYSKQTGYGLEDLIGNTPKILHRDDGDDTERARVRTAIDSRSGCSAVIRNFRADGIPYRCQLTISPIRDESGAVEYFLGISQEISN